MQVDVAPYAVMWLRVQRAEAYLILQAKTTQGSHHTFALGLFVSTGQRRRYSGIVIIGGRSWSRISWTSRLKPSF